jgi:hypothetical protein
MKLFVIICCLVILTSCNRASRVQSTEQIPEFELLSASYEKWAAGIEDGGRGIDYQLILRALIDANDVKFDSLLVENKLQNIRTQRNPSEPVFTSESFGVSKGDTVILHATYLENENFSHVKNDDQSEAVIIYFINKNRKTLKVNYLEEKKGVPRH